MNAEYLQLARQIKLAAAGGANVTTISFEFGAPYHHLTMWVRANTIGGTVNVTAQPLFGDVNNGTSTAVGNSTPTKVYQMADFEMRPATNITIKHPSDINPATPLKSALKLTNNDSSGVEISVFMVAISAAGAM